MYGTSRSRQEDFSVTAGFDASALAAFLRASSPAFGGRTPTTLMHTADGRAQGRGSSDNYRRRRTRNLTLRCCLPSRGPAPKGGVESVASESPSSRRSSSRRSWAAKRSCSAARSTNSRRRSLLSMRVMGHIVTTGRHQVVIPARRPRCGHGVGASDCGRRRAQRQSAGASSACKGAGRRAPDHCMNTCHVNASSTSTETPVAHRR